MAITNENRTLIIRDASLIFKNFAGKESEFNRDGKRSFSVVIEDAETAQEMIRDGWNLKPLKKRNEEDEQRWHLSVEVRYDNFPPRIVMRRNGRANVDLDEESVACLDYAHIRNAYVNINPSRWTVQGRGGIKAYLKSMIVDIEEDELMAMLEEDQFGGPEY